VISDLRLAGEWLLVAMVIVAATPLLVAIYQFALIGDHFRRNHYDRCAPYFPRTAILVPAWNEAAVIGNSIDRLMLLDYPRHLLRVYVVDDASTDETPEVVQAKALQYSGNVVHLRRDKGGEGKAHTLNHGLRVILGDDWMEALLIMDADVIYEPSSLRMMTRHLADTDVGAVTAYIKEGSQPGNYMTRFIGYEYVTAQAAARRAQNVLGVLACLAGGAQLHSRANLEAIGGRIDTSSLAEDTFTTFKTQLAGRRVVFEPHAVVWAEEPGSINALWKQRLRWARGNVQVTKQFSHVWFRRSQGHGLGGVSFGLFWFCIFLLPLIMVLASASLIALYFADFPLAWSTFRVLWIINVVSYVFTTSFALLIDTEVAKRCWREAALFPGAVSLVIIVYTCFPKGFTWLVRHGAAALGFRVTVFDVHAMILFAFAWLAACMLVALCGKLVEDSRPGKVLSPLFVYVGGYGPLLCAITFSSYVKELRGAEMKWEKTEKTGKVVMPT
jgi:cellulose synthase/poly-beta-1,6-N-acetylglucosamine synthase-like glycosyltransferase